MTARRRICVFTGSRAEYGLLGGILRAIHEDPALDLQLVVSGTHLAPEFGLTVGAIEADGFPIAARIALGAPGGSGADTATAMGQVMLGCAEAYQRLRPDLLVVLGDRFEVFAAAAAALPFRIPVAHLAGGEATEGAMDEALRHAVSKLSLLHFTNHERYAKRVVQLGEHPSRVFCFGHPGLDALRSLPLADEAALRREFEVPEERRLGVLTYHPVTLGGGDPAAEVREVLAAADGVPGLFWVITAPNADAGGRAILAEIHRHAAGAPGRAVVVASLGQARYLGLLRCAAVMLGNSSSGLLEAPSFGLPVVDVGDRQRGRIAAANVVHVARCRREDIAEGLARALAPAFRASLAGMVNPYGDGRSSARVVAVLKAFPLDAGVLAKAFHDLP